VAAVYIRYTAGAVGDEDGDVLHGLFVLS